MAGRERLTGRPAALATGIKHFTFHGDDAPVLRNIDLAFQAGSFSVILGASGCGKSTLGRLLAGWVQPGPGGTLAGHLDVAGTRLDFAGHPEDPRIDAGAWGRHVSFVPQDAWAVVSTVAATVAEELAFGLENAGMARGRMRAAVSRTAGMLGLTALLSRHPATLSGGQLRRLAVGCAVIADPAVLVLDEPFASLDAAGTDELAVLLRELVAGGTAVVVLSQTIDEALLQADRWVALDAGTVSASGTPVELMASPENLPAGIRRPRQQRDPGLRDRTRTATARTGTRPGPADGTEAEDAVLELRGVHFAYRATKGRGRKTPGISGGAEEHRGIVVLDNIDLRLKPGEIIAVTGPNGAGKSTLLRHLNGLLQPTSGAVLVNGKPIAGLPVGEVAAFVGLLFQNPRDQLFERTAAREVRFGLDRRFGSGEAAERTAAALAAVGLSAVAHVHPAELPASSQRLLALATVLARKPRVLALDEPTVALDGRGLAMLDAAVRSAADEGAAVVIVTHDLAYAASVADRRVALDGGALLPC